jgi:hypothetical protein
MGNQVSACVENQVILNGQTTRTFLGINLALMGNQVTACVEIKLV